MTHIITSLCLRDSSCVEVCPVECIVPGRPTGQWPWYYIDPDVCIDCGATVNGYRSDITRDWVVGEPTNEQNYFYAAVMRAYNQALSLVRPGTSSKVINAAARAEFVNAGMDDCWRHSIGHGVGLAIHESPSLRESPNTVLVAGDVVTIEPGAYRSGWGGVRIEDLLVVTDDGARMLSGAPRGLRVISA